MPTRGTKVSTSNHAMVFAGCLWSINTRTITPKVMMMYKAMIMLWTYCIGSLVPLGSLYNFYLAPFRLSRLCVRHCQGHVLVAFGHRCSCSCMRVRLVFQFFLYAQKYTLFLELQNNRGINACAKEAIVMERGIIVPFFCDWVLCNWVMKYLFLSQGWGKNTKQFNFFCSMNLITCKNKKVW